MNYSAPYLRQNHVRTIKLTKNHYRMKTYENVWTIKMHTNTIYNEYLPIILYYYSVAE